VGLEHDGDRLVKEFSRGMKQRLGIAEVLVKEAKVVIMDEPTLGIDPDGVTRILDLIVSITRDQGRTVLLSSHLLHQVQQICHRIGIIVKGKLLVQGQLDQLGSAILKEHQWNFLLEVAGNTNGLEKELRSLTGVAEIQQRSKGWLLRCTRDIRAELLSLLNRKNLSLLQLCSEDPTLEEIYLKYFREA
jgi:ABC-2 type transport system ATP-binding protein